MAAAKKPAKKVKVQGASNYTPNSAVYKLPMTPKQAVAFNKLYSSPKFKDTLFTIPKGTERMSQKEKDQMQKRRLADRKRTLARAESIIRRTVGKPKI
jgi:long-subunit fatty acid transport protein